MRPRVLPNGGEAVLDEVHQRPAFDQHPLWLACGAGGVDAVGEARRVIGDAMDGLVDRIPGGDGRRHRLNVNPIGPLRARWRPVLDRRFAAQHDGARRGVSYYEPYPSGGIASLHRDEHSADLHHGQLSGQHLDATARHDDDEVADRHPRRGEAVGEGIGPAVEFRIGPGALRVRDRGGVGGPGNGLPEELQRGNERGNGPNGGGVHHGPIRRLRSGGRRRMSRVQAAGRARDRCLQRASRPARVDG